MNVFSKSFLLATCVLSSASVYNAHAVLGDEALAGLSTVKKMPWHHADLFPSETLVPLEGPALAAAKARVTAHMESNYSSEVTTLVTELSPRLGLAQALVNEERIKVHTGGKATWTNIDRHRRGLPDISGEGVDYYWTVFPGRIQQLDEVASKGQEWLEVFRDILGLKEELSAKSLFRNLANKTVDELVRHRGYTEQLISLNVSNESLVKSAELEPELVSKIVGLVALSDINVEGCGDMVFETARKMSDEKLDYLVSQAGRISAMIGQEALPSLLIASLSKLSIVAIADFLEAFETHGPDILAGYEEIEDTCPRERTVAERKAATMAAATLMNPTQIASLAGILLNGSVLGQMAPYNREPAIRQMAKVDAVDYPELLDYYTVENDGE